MAEGGFFDKLAGIDLGSLGAAGLGYYGYSQGKKDLSQFAQDAKAGQAQAWEQFSPSFEFKPFTVTTGTGGTTGYSDGQMSMNLSAQEQALQNQLMQQAQGLYGQAGGDIGQRTQDIYQNMYQGMAPELERQRLANEERMRAQGRMGISSNMYGGANPDMYNMNMAQQEAMNKMYLGARQQAQQEQSQLGNLAQSMFTQAYTPQAQMLNAYQQGLAGQQAQQQAMQQYGTAGMESYLTGLDAQLQANLGKANLTGNYITSLADMFRPTINPKTGEVVKNSGLFGGLNVGDVFGGLSGFFGPATNYDATNTEGDDVWQEAQRYYDNWTSTWGQ